MQDYQQTFIDLALSRQALRFGHFKLKSGRESPYFFNAGLFSDGEAIAVLGRCYAAAIARSGIAFDMLFGPAYKGIPLAAATAAALFEGHGRSVPYAFNRKEAKDHGEGGSVIGAPLEGRVLVIDDVVTAGTAVRESLALIRGQGAQPAGVVFALDRQERGQGALSATQEIEREQGIPCVSVVTLTDLIEALSHPSSGRSVISDDQLTLLRAYRQRYGIT
jgi:orotate phosphoribosyltransferase